MLIPRRASPVFTDLFCFKIRLKFCFFAINQVIRAMTSPNCKCKQKRGRVR
jgi:hypothetical protein